MTNEYTMSDQEYIESYLKTIDTPSGNTKRLFAIGMIGLNGSGKSTIAEALGKELNIYVASNDKIRRWMNEQGFSGDAPRQDLLQHIAETSSQYLYNQQISHIIDADLLKFHENARQKAEASAARFFLIRVITPEEVILERLGRRKEKINTKEATTLSRAGAEEYFKRKQIHEEVPAPREGVLTIRGDNDIIDNITTIINYLAEHDVIQK